MPRPDVPDRRPASDYMAEARRYERDGEFFKAYDIASQGIAEHPGDKMLAHRAVLSLANAGATALARKKFAELGLAGRGGTEIVALDARLLKDASLAASGKQRRALLLQSAATYARAYAQALAAGNPNAYYPGINVASLRLLAGEDAAARAVAREVLAIVERRMAEPGFDQASDAYWVLATAMEASLILDDNAKAEALIPRTLAANRGESVALASSARQLRQVLAAKNYDLSRLAAFAPPQVVHYTGHMIAAPGERGRLRAEDEPAMTDAIARTLDRRKVGAAYGSLAAGADILFAEALLRRGASLNIVLPFALEEFVEQSVRPSGTAWIPRFHACLSRATTVRYATDDQYLGDDHLYGYCSELAMGLAIVCARHLGAEARQLAIWDGKAARAVAGTAVDLALWRRKGHEQTIIRCGDGPDENLIAASPRDRTGAGRNSCAMLFGDIKGFSKLTDRQIPVFMETVIASLGRVIDARADDVAMVNTWGDGLFLVFEDAGVAAQTALALQDSVARLDLAARGLPPTMALRLGGHLGPIYRIDDPILHRPNYLGAHVSRAARIEPITPEGCVYVTETFAAILALHNPTEFACDYVGVTEMAKHYGSMRMFLLRRAGDAAAAPFVLRQVH